MDYIDTETRNALKADLSLRCFHRARLTLGSRRSADVIRWAESLAETLIAMLGPEMSGFSVKLNAVLLLRSNRRNVVLICFDIFHGKCPEEVRNMISQSFERPIHQIRRRENACYIQREEKLDATVAAEYTRLGKLDNGPRPFFADLENPPVYCNGSRIETPDGNEAG
jgi:hypothetical protein